MRPICIFLVGISLLRDSEGHGMMLEPPGRSSLWRTDSTAIPNYTDNELNCGGASVQWNTNFGKCGECGDNFSLSRPRPNEEGGTYGSLQKVPRTYTVGQTVTTTIKLTANHLGYFEFRLCPRPTYLTLTNQNCLDSNLLTVKNGQGTRYYLPTNTAQTFYPEIQLPANIACEYCTLQWHYFGGNNWGDCGNGTSKLGCGPQETFKNCADIKITGTTQPATTIIPQSTTTTKATAAPITASTTTTKAPTTQTGSAFKCTTNGLFADPLSCSKFYQCSNGVAYSMSCGTGLYFNPTLKVCDWPYNVSCP